MCESAGNPVQPANCSSPADRTLIGFSIVPVGHRQSAYLQAGGGVGAPRTFAGGVQRPHVEDVDTLHLSENLKTLQTGGLLKVGRDSARLGTGSDEVFLNFDLCMGETLFSLAFI